MSSTPYSTQDAALFAQLADLANTSFGDSDQDLFLPSGWNLLKTVTVNSVPGLSGLQAYFASGPLPSTLRKVAVLAVGAQWQGLMNWYRSTLHVPVPLDAFFVNGSASVNQGTRELVALRQSLGQLMALPRLEPAAMGLQPALAADQRRTLRHLANALTSEGGELARSSERGGREHRALTGALEELTALCGDAASSLAELEDAVDRSRLRRPVDLTAEFGSAGYQDFFDSIEDAATRALSASSALLRARVGLEAATPGSFDLGYQLLYGYLRNGLWAQLSFVGKMDLYVVGHAVAAPLAQLAALDLRPGKASTTSPVTSITPYSFSTPALGDQAFATWFAAQVPNSYAVVAQGTTAVDFFPTAPTQGSGYYQGSQVQPLEAKIPAPDDPWYERSSDFYASLLGADLSLSIRRAGRTLRPLSAQGSPEEVAVLRAHLLAAPGAADPAGYDGDLAYSLALLSAAAYQRYQHPNLPLSLPQPWSLASDVQAGGVTFASLFTTPTEVAVVFRGTATWEELFTVQGNFQLTYPRYLQGAGQASAGFSNLYSQLRATLFAALQAISGLSNRQFYVTGHSLGGALATLCAADLQQGQPSLPAPSALYTFGAPPVGSYSFQSYFSALPLAAKAFRIARPYDVVANLTFSLFAQAPAAPVSLPGSTDQDGTTHHAITTYIELLNPQAGN